jgi:hypothetical protein
MRTLLGNFIANMGREDIFKLITRNECLHETSDNGDDGVRPVNSATSKICCQKNNVPTLQNSQIHFDF